ncbi:MAG: FHA domain-containing protein [Myxococcota bacterium]
MTKPEHWVTAPTGVARRRWRLVVESGPDEGLRADLSVSPSLVGAAPGSVLALSDDTVSRYHAELDLLAAGLRIRDLRSTNGTYFEDREGPVSEGFLWPGRRFRLGETWLRVDAIDEPYTPPDSSREPVQLGGLVGRSALMQGVFRAAMRLSKGDGPVLMIGPVGSGRGAIARQMHRLSYRRSRPLVSVDMTVDGQTVLTDERSPLLRAINGTLLLRNIDQLARAQQAALAAIIERGSLRPGGKQRVDVRILSTCVDINDIDPSLRRHLDVAVISVPPLSARNDELVPLAEHFLHGAGWKSIRLGEKTRRQLQQIRWQDQVAGLSRLVQRLPLAPDTVDDAIPDLPSVRKAFLSDLMMHHQGDVTAASTDLAVPCDQLFRTLHVCSIDIDGS